MQRLRYQNGAPDAVDRAILALLAGNARISTAELARGVALSPPSVAERVRRLEEAGIIEGYAAMLDTKALGYPLAAYLRIRPIPGKLQKTIEVIEGIDAIIECHRVTGEDCFIAKAVAASVEDLERIIDRIIPFAMTNTSIIQSSPVKHRLPPIGERRR